MMSRRNWTREETILAFELYCRTPYNKITVRNQEILDLAEVIQRVPKAVVAKMYNLASKDPFHIERGAKALSNGSHWEADLWLEFGDNWQELAYQAEIIKESQYGIRVNEEILQDIEYIPEGKTRDQAIRARVGQYFFRNTVLSAYGNRCCITGISIPELLIASHIKPWAEADPKTERTNPRNGLCLNALHDKAFDKGFITINNKYEIILSNKLKEMADQDSTIDWLVSSSGKQIIEADKFRPAKEFIDYHNDVIFLG